MPAGSRVPIHRFAQPPREWRVAIFPKTSQQAMIFSVQTSMLLLYLEILKTRSRGRYPFNYK